MLPAELGPFSKLVLAARRRQLASHPEVFGLRFALLGRGLGGRYGEEVEKRP